MVLFYERLGVWDYLAAIIRGRLCYYATMSGVVRILNNLIGRGRFSSTNYAEEFGWGDTEYVGHSIRNAGRMHASSLRSLREPGMPEELVAYQHLESI